MLSVHRSAELLVITRNQHGGPVNEASPGKQEMQLAHLPVVPKQTKMRDTLASLEIADGYLQIPDAVSVSDGLDNDLDIERHAILIESECMEQVERIESESALRIVDPDSECFDADPEIAEPAAETGQSRGVAVEAPCADHDRAGIRPEHLQEQGNAVRVVLQIGIDLNGVRKPLGERRSSSSLNRCAFTGVDRQTEQTHSVESMDGLGRAIGAAVVDKENVGYVRCRSGGNRVDRLTVVVKRDDDADPVTRSVHWGLAVRVNRSVPREAGFRPEFTQKDAS